MKKIPLSCEELDRKVSAVLKKYGFDGVDIETDNQGQIVLYTGLIEKTDGFLRKMTQKDLQDPD